MHELSLASSLVDSAQKIALDHNAQKVLNVTILVGALSGVEKEPLLFCFDEVTQGTLLEGAKLIVQEVPMEVLCEGCGHTYIPDKIQLSCPKCLSDRVKIIKGQELQLIDMEIE